MKTAWLLLFALLLGESVMAQATMAAGNAAAGGTKPAAKPVSAVSKQVAKPAAKPIIKTAATQPARRPSSWIDGSGPSYANRADAMKLADQIAREQQIDRAWVRRVISQARQVPMIRERVIPGPVSSRNWQRYRETTVDALRVREGLAFWRRYADLLERASETYGVPPEIIVGIIGVETFYGRNLGNFRVLEALLTLSLDFPDQHPRAEARRAFFRSELAAFLKLCKQTGRDPMQVRGSYAGAVGIPQFMPSNWERYGVDFDGDGRVDLSSSMADAIGSVANYFKSFGWKPGMPTHYPVAFDYQTLDMAVLLAPDINPTFAAADLTSLGVVLDDEARAHAGPMALVELHNGDSYSPSYVVGTENFYTVTRYNWSSYYALVVIELGQTVLTERRKEVEAAATLSASNE